MGKATPIKKPKLLQRWRITLVRKKGQPIGTVEVRTAEEAIETAIREYSINDPQKRRRPIAQPIE